MVKRPSTLVNRPHIYSLHSLHPSPHSSLPIVQMSLRNGENYLKDERIGTRLGSGWNKFRDSGELKAMTALGQPFKLRSDRHQITHSFSSRCKLDNSFLSHLFLYFILAAFLTLHLHHLHPTKLQMFKMPRIVQTSSNRKHVSCQHPSLPFSSSL